jgi:hypothetical protein
MFILEENIPKNNFLEENNNLINEENNNLINEENNNLIDNELNIEENINISIQKKKQLLDLVKNLSSLEYKEIFNIIQENNCQYSGNNNGIFINLQNVNDDIINKIFNFIEFIKKKKKELHEKDSILENIKKNIYVNEIKEEIITKDQTYENENTFSDDNEEEINYDKYLCFSSDEDNDLENKLSLKKKKIKYSGKNAKLIKSIKDTSDKNKNI